MSALPCHPCRFCHLVVEAAGGEEADAAVVRPFTDDRQIVRGLVLRFY